MKILLVSGILAIACYFGVGITQSAEVGWQLVTDSTKSVRLTTKGSADADIEADCSSGGDNVRFAVRLRGSTSSAAGHETLIVETADGAIANIAAESRRMDPNTVTITVTERPLIEMLFDFLWTAQRSFKVGAQPHGFAEFSSSGARSQIEKFATMCDLDRGESWLTKDPFLQSIGTLGPASERR